MLNLKKWLPQGISISQTVTGMGLLIALHLVMNQFSLVLTPTLKISFAFLTSAVMGAVYGPIYAGLGAIFTDILGFVLKPSGFFFPGFTLNAFLAGIIYGVFLFQKGYNVKRIILAKVVTTVLVSFILTPIWLNIMYQSPLFIVARYIRTAIKFPIDVALLLLVMRTLYKTRIYAKMTQH